MQVEDNRNRPLGLTQSDRDCIIEMKITVIKSKQIQDFDNCPLTQGDRLRCRSIQVRMDVLLSEYTSFIGNYHESLRDATAAYQLQPTYLKAIIRGIVFLIF